MRSEEEIIIPVHSKNKSRQLKYDKTKRCSIITNSNNQYSSINNSTIIQKNTKENFQNIISLANNTSNLLTNSNTKTKTNTNTNHNNKIFFINNLKKDKKLISKMIFNKDQNQENKNFNNIFSTSPNIKKIINNNKKTDFQNFQAKPSINDIFLNHSNDKSTVLRKNLIELDNINNITDNNNNKIKSPKTVSHKVSNINNNNINIGINCENIYNNNHKNQILLTQNNYIRSNKKENINHHNNNILNKAKSFSDSEEGSINGLDNKTIKDDTLDNNDSNHLVLKIANSNNKNDETMNEDEKKLNCLSETNTIETERTKFILSHKKKNIKLSYNKKKKIKGKINIKKKIERKDHYEEDKEKNFIITINNSSKSEMKIMNYFQEIMRINPKTKYHNKHSKGIKINAVNKEIITNNNNNNATHKENNKEKDVINITESTVNNSETKKKNLNVFSSGGEKIFGGGTIHYKKQISNNIQKILEKKKKQVLKKNSGKIQILKNDDIFFLSSDIINNYNPNYRYGKDDLFNSSHNNFLTTMNYLETKTSKMTNIFQDLYYNNKAYIKKKINLNNNTTNYANNNSNKNQRQNQFFSSSKNNLKITKSINHNNNSNIEEINRNNTKKNNDIILLNTFNLSNKSNNKKHHIIKYKNEIVKNNPKKKYSNKTNINTSSILNNSNILSIPKEEMNLLNNRLINLHSNEIELKKINENTNNVFISHLNVDISSLLNINNDYLKRSLSPRIINNNSTYSNISNKLVLINKKKQIQNQKNITNYNIDENNHKQFFLNKYIEIVNNDNELCDKNFLNSERSGIKNKDNNLTNNNNDNNLNQLNIKSILTKETKNINTNKENNIKKIVKISNNNDGNINENEKTNENRSIQNKKENSNKKAINRKIFKSPQNKSRTEEVLSILHKTMKQKMKKSQINNNNNNSKIINSNINTNNNNNLRNFSNYFEESNKNQNKEKNRILIKKDPQNSNNILLDLTQSNIPKINKKTQDKINNFNNKTSSSKSKKTNKYIKTHTHKKSESSLSSLQIPIVAEENAKIMTLKIMKYNKCTYTNHVLAFKMKKLFVEQKTLNIFLSFLSKKDLYNLSLVNSFYHKATIKLIYKIIINKILSKSKEQIIEIIWNKKLLENSSFNENNITSTNTETIYKKYLNISNKYDNDITKDINRTFPNEESFHKGSESYYKLFNVLKAYSNYNSYIGYAQGMNFIVAKLILIFKNETKTFIYLDALFNKLNMANVIGVKNNLENKMNIIQSLLDKLCPDVNKYLNSKSINHEIFTASWLITLFSKNFKSDHILINIWNFSIIFGWKFIFLFTISVIIFFKNIFIKLDLYSFTQYMKNIFRSDEFKQKFNEIIKKTFDYMPQWKTLINGIVIKI